MTCPHATTGANGIDHRCLDYDPFAGDRDCNITVFTDKLVTGRAEHKCQICWGPIAKGEQHRARTERDNTDKVVMTFRFCGLCCEAMVKSMTDFEDNGDAISERTQMGMRASGNCPWLDEQAALQGDPHAE